MPKSSPWHPCPHLLLSSLTSALPTHEQAVFGSLRDAYPSLPTTPLFLPVQAAFGSLKDAYATAAKAVGPGAAEASLKQFIGLEQLMLATVGVSHVRGIGKMGRWGGSGLTWQVCNQSVILGHFALVPPPDPCTPCWVTFGWPWACTMETDSSLSHPADCTG